MKRPADVVIDRWLARMPDATKAYYHDPMYRAQFTQLRRMLVTMDMAMEDEGVPEDVRLRIVRTVVYGGPDETEALARMERLEHPPIDTGQIQEWLDLRGRSELQPTEMDKLSGMYFDKQREYVNKGKPPIPQRWVG